MDNIEHIPLYILTLVYAIEQGTPTEQWPAERVENVTAQYRRVEHRLLATHSRDDDEGLAIRLSAFASSIGY